MLVDVSCVVVAQMHNPTVVHPAFLSNEGIVPSDWALAADPICTPALAQVMYQNGFSISVQPARAVVKIENAPAHLAMRIVVDVTGSFMSRLPYVPYKALGFNLTYFMEMENVDRFLVDNLLPGRISENTSYTPILAEPKILYTFDEGQATLQFVSGMLQTPHWSEPRGGIFLRSNLHHDLDQNDPVKAARLHLANLFRFDEWCKGVAASIIPQIGGALTGDIEHD